MGRVSGSGQAKLVGRDPAFSRHDVGASARVGFSRIDRQMVVRKLQHKLTDRWHEQVWGSEGEEPLRDEVG